MERGRYEVSLLIILAPRSNSGYYPQFVCRQNHVAGVFMTSIEAVRASRVNSRIHKILSELRGLNTHVAFLCGTGTTSGLDGRDLMRCAMEAKAFAIQLHHELENLADLASSVTRSG